MVGFVIVSHSEILAEGVKDLCSMMAKDVPVAPAGGLSDGGHGTSSEKITAAIKSADRGDGVLVLMDMGSAVMTAEMVIETCGCKNVKMVDCPLVEGAVTGSILSSAGAPIEEITEELAAVAGQKKMDFGKDHL